MLTMGSPSRTKALRPLRDDAGEGGGFVDLDDLDGGLAALIADLLVLDGLALLEDLEGEAEQDVVAPAAVDVDELGLIEDGSDLAVGAGDGRGLADALGLADLVEQVAEALDFAFELGDVLLELVFALLGALADAAELLVELVEVALKGADLRREGALSLLEVLPELLPGLGELVVEAVLGFVGAGDLSAGLFERALDGGDALALGLQLGVERPQLLKQRPGVVADHGGDLLTDAVGRGVGVGADDRPQRTVGLEELADDGPLAGFEHVGHDLGGALLGADVAVELIAGLGGLLLGGVELHREEDREDQADDETRAPTGRGPKRRRRFPLLTRAMRTLRGMNLPRPGSSDARPGREEDRSRCDR